MENLSKNRIKMVTGEVLFFTDIVAVAPIFGQVFATKPGAPQAVNYILDIHTSEGFTVRSELFVIPGHPDEEKNKSLVPTLGNDCDTLMDDLLKSTETFRSYKQLKSGHVFDVNAVRSITGVREVPYPPEQRIHESSFTILFKGGCGLMVSNRQDLRGMNKLEEAEAVGAIKELHDEAMALWEQA